MALPGANFTTGQALLVALISAAMYGVFLQFKLKHTRACLFTSMKMTATTMTRTTENRRRMQQVAYRLAAGTPGCGNRRNQNER